MNIITSPVQYKPQTQHSMVKEKKSPESSLLSQDVRCNPQHVAMVGREAALATLHYRLESALQGQRQIIFLTGEPGIGKTALVDVFLKQLCDRIDLCVTSGQCVEQYGTGEAYFPLLEATQKFCRAPGGEQHIAVLQRYAPSWLAQLPGLLEPDAFEYLQQCVHGASRERMLREMAEAVELLTIQRGLVLVLEDLHWSDISTLEWVTYMARRRELAKLLIIGTYRPTEARASNHLLHGATQELRARGQCEEWQLTPLSEEEISEYLRVRFKSNTDALSSASLQQLTSALHRRTGGNPLFLVNTVDDLIRQGVFAEEARGQLFRANVGEALSKSIPDTVRQLIERQLERLPASEQRLLKVASVAGVEFAVAEAAAGLPIEQDTIEAACERLARTGHWLRAVGAAEWPDGTISGRYSFLHAVHHEAVYAQLPELRRMQAHRRIAARKEAAYGERAGEIAAELAVHFVEGRDYHKAVQYLQHAGKNALQRSAHQEAINYLSRARSLLTRQPETRNRIEQELQILTILGSALMAGKGYAAPEVEDLYARAHELCQQVPETPQLLPVLGGLWVFYQVRAQLSKARELAERILMLARELPQPTALLYPQLWLGQTLFSFGELRMSHEHLEHSFSLYDPQQNSPRTVVAPQDPGETCLAYTSWILWLLGYPEQALERSHQARALSKELNHPLSLAHALHFAAWLYLARKEPQAVQVCTETASQVLGEEGSSYRLAQGMILSGRALVEQGQEAKGLALMQQGVTAWKTTGAEALMPCYLGLLAEVYHKTGQVDAGLGTLQQAIDLSKSTEERWYEAELYRLYGELSLQACERTEKRKGEEGYVAPSSSETCFHKALEIARSQKAKSLELRAAMSLVRLWRQQQKGDEARELLQEIYDWFTEGFDTKDLQDAAELLRELGGNVERVGTRDRATGNRQPAEEERPLARVAVQGSRFKVQHAEPTPNPRSSRLSPQSSAIYGQHSALSPQLSSSPASSPQPPTPNLFHRHDKYWTVSFAGVTCRLKAAHGLHYIVHLLQHPHEECHVLTLIGVRAKRGKETREPHPVQDRNLSSNPGKRLPNTHEILDPQVQAAYQQRLSELREELEEAQALHDLGRSEQLTAELDMFTHKLIHAVSVGEQTQQVDSPIERARVIVTKAIKSTLKKITTHHPSLGRHLTLTIKTGVYCVYNPDPRVSTAWQTSTQLEE